MCVDSTTRLIATRMGITLDELRVDVRAHVDVRGTLMVDPTVPVGFQRLEVDIHVAAAEVDPARIDALLQMVEHCCVVMQTLRGGVTVEVSRGG